jgi:signal peptidase I
MGALTGVLYGILLLYLGGWYIDKWSGNFSFLLFVLTVVTCCYWLAERFRFAPARSRAALDLDQQDIQRRAQLAKQGIAKVDGDIRAAREALLMQPWWLDWTAGLFPVILIVFLLRSFLFEPFKIPSPSMVPTLRVGDLILVNKFHYGLRLPVVNQKIFQLNNPQRGDVMVFRYPKNPSMDYIKRVVGLPGDEVAYRNKELYLNGSLVETQPVEDFFDDGWTDNSPSSRKIYAKQFSEKLGDASHRLLVERGQNTLISPFDTFPYKENCNYSAEGLTCKVPEGHYFLMGDNRDHSEDSRFWGFVPDKNIVGKAFFIWMNFSNFKRFGPFH